MTKPSWYAWRNDWAGMPEAGTWSLAHVKAEPHTALCGAAIPENAVIITLDSAVTHCKECTRMSEQTTSDVTPSQAKKIVKDYLDRYHVTYDPKLTAETVDFQDLARADCVFVRVSGFKPTSDVSWDDLKRLAVSHHFRVRDDGLVGS